MLGKYLYLPWEMFCTIKNMMECIEQNSKEIVFVKILFIALKNTVQCQKN